MNRRALPLALLTVGAWTAANGAAAVTLYVTDELVLGVYGEENSGGQRLTTLHSGSSVESISVSGEFTQVRLSDGTIGWVKSSFLTGKEPATVRVKQLEEELARTRATTPALAEAAARSEVERLQGELSASRAEAAQARSAVAAAPGSQIPTGRGLEFTWRWCTAMGAGFLAALAVGFWLGYAVLERRVRRKFGGLRVY